MNDPRFEYPGYMSHNRAFTVKCVACGAVPMTRCVHEGRYMEGYTHIQREKDAARDEWEAREAARIVKHNLLANFKTEGATIH